MMEVMEVMTSIVNECEMLSIVPKTILDDLIKDVW